MEFLSTPLWWAFFAIEAAAYFVYSLARRNRELQVRWLNFLGGWCAWVSLLVVILASVFTGWKGGLAILVGIIPVAIVGIVVIRLIFRSR